MESWKSGRGAAVVDFGFSTEGGGAGETRSSRHCAFLAWEALFGRGKGPVGVVSIVAEGVGATDWNAWIGSASKNSWAKMKGDFDGSRVRD